MSWYMNEYDELFIVDFVGEGFKLDTEIGMGLGYVSTNMYVEWSRMYNNLTYVEDGE
jgi:hypothetical protein